ncbi:MAG: 16S rRNA (cytosine(967)-C(5))-methyltransferase RsmB, partial [Pseudomonadota bacterium]
MNSTSSDARQMALEALEAVVGGGKHLRDALDAATFQCADARERALARELGFGVIRWTQRLSALRRLLVPRKPKPLRLDLILQLGLYQLEYTRIPAHAAVSATVDLTRRNRLQHARGMVNATLRRYQRERQHLLDSLDRSAPARHAHPQWWLDRLASDWPDRWQAVAAANNARAPLTLRVNQRRVSRAEYLDRLEAAGIGAGACAFAPCGVNLTQTADPTSLPGFADGLVSVQDGAGQLITQLLTAKPGLRVLDACAAPGGKATALLEHFPGLELHAIDNDAARVDRLRGNLARLGLSARIDVADAARPEDWWDRRAYDVIVLDVPCTASGIVRRHPDIRLARGPGDIDRNAT